MVVVGVVGVGGGVVVGGFDGGDDGGDGGGGGTIEYPGSPQEVWQRSG